MLESSFLTNIQNHAWRDEWEEFIYDTFRNVQLIKFLFWVWILEQLDGEEAIYSGFED